jgi:hypothetical protein
VDLREYRFRSEYPGWFLRTTGEGRREETVAFEEDFRLHAPKALEAWFEVVYWKLAGRNPDGGTQAITRGLSSRRTTAAELWDKCSDYVHSQESDARTKFKDFHQLFGFTSDRIAVVATFPAFMDPYRFAMVDTRVAKWVGEAMGEHNMGDPRGVQLVRPPLLDSTRTTLGMSDFEFMVRWISWCRYNAKKLTQLGNGFRWRARDVEMAVFYAWGEKKERQHPKLRLPPVPSTEASVGGSSS